MRHDGGRPGDRLATLRQFAKHGIFTWVSLEPTIDVEASLAIVDATHEFVDLYKVGRVNYLAITKTTDWRDYTLRMIEKLNKPSLAISERLAGVSATARALPP